jgi:predicted metal-dependent hydrolase
MTVSGINVDVVYKQIKNLHIGVYPPVGRVRVAAPEHFNDEQVRLAVVQRLPWIQKHRRRLREAERQSERQMVNGESHYFSGRRLRLEVIETSGRPGVKINRDRLELRIPPGADTQARRSLLDRWYRARLRESIGPLIDEWAPKVGHEVAGWSVRRMKTKWGSCNQAARRLWFNLELAKKHPRCVEYLVVHEVVHLEERGHGDRFISLMDDLLPDWRQRRDELNGAPLAAEEWAA